MHKHSHYCPLSPLILLLLDFLALLHLPPIHVHPLQLLNPCYHLLLIQKTPLPLVMTLMTCPSLLLLQPLFHMIQQCLLIHHPFLIIHSSQLILFKILLIFLYCLKKNTLVTLFQKPCSH